MCIVLNKYTNFGDACSNIFTAINILSKKFGDCCSVNIKFLSPFTLLFYPWWRSTELS